MAQQDFKTRLWLASRRPHARLLSGEQPQTVAERLAELAVAGIDLDCPPDAYGDGIVQDLEQQVAALLGKPGAVLFPSGTMAQQVALRIWAERSGRRQVALHPLHHTLLHEDRAFEAVAGLEAVYPTQERRHPNAAELRTLPPEVAAVVLELPFQELGYVLPTWDDYLDLAAVTRAQGAALHLDGARLWETTPWFGRDLPEIAGPADSVYLSLYKLLGAPAGAVLVGGEELVAAARPWRHRYGGRSYGQWPTVVAALHGLATRLPRVAALTEQARLVAAALARLPGLELRPAVPQIRQFRVHAALPAEALNQAVVEHAEETGWRFLHGWRSVDDGALAEMTVAEPAMAWTVQEIVSVGEQVLGRARALADA